MSNSIGLTGLLPSPHGNATLINNNDLCTLTTCDLTLAQVDYLPSLLGNALFAAIFGICFVAQLYLGVKYRTWGFMTATTLGMLTEIIGYIGRIMMHNNPFSKNNFLIYLVTLTIAPAFLSAAIYLCLARIVVVYGEERSRFRPRTYTIMFCSCDFLALLLQAAGGAIASISKTNSGTQTGINIMLAGLSFQVFSLLLFSVACIDFGLRVYCFDRVPGHPYASQARRDGNYSPSSIITGAPLHTNLPQTRLFRAFLIGLSLATLTIFIRSCFRVAELSSGFHGSLANNEVSFMILEGAMVITACLALTILHPGVCFQGEWRAANFKMGNSKIPRDVVGNRISGGSSLGSDEETDGPKPPVYSQSLATLDSNLSFDDAASVRVESMRTSLRAQAMRATPIRAEQVNVEMLPVYGIRYQSTSDAFPVPTS